MMCWDGLQLGVSARYDSKVLFQLSIVLRNNPFRAVRVLQSVARERALGFILLFRHERFF